MFFSINHATCFFSKVFMNINVLFSYLHLIDLFLIRKFKRFKKRIRFKFKVIIRETLFK